jgi:3-deoxy-D-manno-octulosonic-acid transferase
MIFVYNFLQVFLLFITFPFLLLIVLGKKKYRSRIGDRMGIGLKKKIVALNPGKRKIIWIHSLSVGEVTSALPLVKGIREEMDQVCVVFSASTRSGMTIALEKIKPHVDLVIAAPLDLLPVVNRFIRLIQPNMFILVETDFWPNWLHSLQRNATPLVLVNGRISQSSFARYRRFNFFFKPLFRSFALLSMQTENDAAQMRQLGIPADRVQTLGNLKYDTNLSTDTDSEENPALTDSRIPGNSLIWVCGSTHPGEEKMIIAAFARLFQTRKDIFLILAPRDPGRGGEIQKLITEHNLQSMRRTRPADPASKILILDTIGELADCYRFAGVAFIGGSLVELGGHNPLEAAAYGVPVLFGPHMDDFLEISRDLTECGGAVTVDSAIQLENAVQQIFDDKTVHQRMSSAARNLVKSNSGVIRHHIQELRSLLPQVSGRT